MDQTIPNDLPRSQIGAMVLFLSEGAEDRGVSMETIIKRSPVAIVDTGTALFTDLSDGTRRTLGGRKIHGVPVMDLSINQYHRLEFEDVNAALSYLRKVYPEMIHLPAEHY